MLLWTADNRKEEESNEEEMRTNDEYQIASERRFSAHDHYQFLQECKKRKGTVSSTHRGCSPDEANCTCGEAEAPQNSLLPVGPVAQPISAAGTVSVVDVAGVTHRKFPPEQFKANVDNKPEGSKKRSCPCCGCYSGCASLTCMNTASCSYTFKKPKNKPSAQPHDYLPDPGTLEMQGQSEVAANSSYQKAVERLKLQYLKRVPVSILQAAFLLYTSPPETLNHYCFDDSTSASRLHCLPARVLQAVLQHPHGLSPAFAKLYEGQRIRGVWFREATKTQVESGIKHCHEQHPDKFTDDDQTVYGIIVPSDHTAIRAILSCKTANMFYSMINIPVAGLKVVKLN